MIVETETYTQEKAAKKALSRPKLKALYMSNKVTIGSVNIMYIGRVMVFVTKYFTLSRIVGFGSADELAPSFFARHFSSTGLYDSDMNSVIARATAIPKSREIGRAHV